MEKYQTFTKNQYFRLLIWRVAGALKKKKRVYYKRKLFGPGWEKKTDFYK